MNDQPIIPPLNLSPNLFDHKGVVFGKMQNPLSVVPCTFPQTTPTRSEMAVNRPSNNDIHLLSYDTTERESYT